MTKHIKLNKDEVVKNFLPKIKIIALNLISGLPKNVELDDLIQEGVIGLLQSFERYNPNSKANFYTYAVKRIKGAMLDYLRKIDWLPKELRQKIKVLEKIYSEMSTDEFLSDEEIAGKLGVSLEELKKIRAEMHRSQILNLDAYLMEDDDTRFQIPEQRNEEYDPEIIAYKELFRERLKKEIQKLPEKEQLILSLYYEQELTFKEIGQILGITESRVSQIHSAIMAKLRAIFGEVSKNVRNSKRSNTRIKKS